MILHWPNSVFFIMQVALDWILLQLIRSSSSIGTLLFHSLLSSSLHHIITVLSSTVSDVSCVLRCRLLYCVVFRLFSLLYTTLSSYLLHFPRFIIIPPLPLSPSLPYSHPSLLFLTSTPPLYLSVIGILRTISKRKPGHTVSDRQKPSMFTV